MRGRLFFAFGTILLLALAVRPVVVSAQYVPADDATAKIEPVQRLRGETQLAPLLCGLVLKTAQLGGPPEKSDYGLCIKQWQEKAMLSYDSAAKVVRKTPAKAALKDYMAAWSATLSGIRPSGEESKITYNARQAQANSRLDELWAKFELENR